MTANKNEMGLGVNPITADPAGGKTPIARAGELAKQIIQITKEAINSKNQLYLMDLFEKVEQFRETMRKVEEEIGNKLFRTDLVAIVNGNILSIYDVTSYTDMLIGEALKFYQFAKYLILGNEIEKQYAQNYLGEIEQRLELFIPSLNALIKLAEA